MPPQVPNSSFSKSSVALQMRQSLCHRIPFKATQDLEPVSEHAFTVSSALVVKMKANMADAPYAFEKGRLTRWQFCLTYARIADFLPLVHHYLAASRLPAAERDEVLQVSP